MIAKYYYAKTQGRRTLRASSGFPLRLENLENGEDFPDREKSGNFEQTGKIMVKSGKITQNTGIFREFQTNIVCYFLVIFN